MTAVRKKTKKKTTKKRAFKANAASKQSGTKMAKTTRSKAPIESLSLQEIEAQLAARKRTLATLERKRSRLQKQITEIDTEIAALTGRAPGGRGRRPRNDANLGDALALVLRNEQMSVTAATQAVIDAGYITTAQNFRTIVNQRLIADKRFKKVERGVYTCTT